VGSVSDPVAGAAVDESRADDSPAGRGDVSLEFVAPGEWCVARGDGILIHGPRRRYAGQDAYAARVDDRRRGGEQYTGDPALELDRGRQLLGRGRGEGAVDHDVDCRAQLAQALLVIQLEREGLGTEGADACLARGTAEGAADVVASPSEDGGNGATYVARGAGDQDPAGHGMSRQARERALTTCGPVCP
jgi:hypothetical protein